jgi:cytochrome c553
MTNAQKWMAAFLALFLVLLIIGRMTKEEDQSEMMSMQMMQQTQQTSQTSDELTSLKQNRCLTCHGSNLQGTKMAPALTGLKENWTRDKLINYLRNPASFGTDERFVEYKAKYKNIVMPSFNNLDVKELGKIADYLLTK